jgi:Tol biopolymer transport system component
LDWGDFPSAAYRVDLVSGDATTLFEFPPDNDWWSGIGIVPTPDGQGVIYANDGKLVRRDLGSSREIELYQDPQLAAGILAVSPDGSELVFGVNDPSEERLYPDSRLHEGGRLMIMPGRGGEAREIFRLDGSRRAGGVWWSPDGSSILLAVRDAKSTTLFRVGRTGSDVERLQQPWSEPAVFTPSPDGHRIAFFVQENEAEIWVMENLVAALKEAEGH